MKKYKILIMSICFIFGILLINNYSDSAYITGNTSGIDEDKYPGYKDKIQQLEREHPNWDIKLLYTGLDWNYVLDNECTGHGYSPKSLIYDTYEEAWRCHEEGCIDRKYDVSGRWYCASRPAVAYMMDPRASLDNYYIFQFQDLSSTSGDRDEIEKMVEGSFLDTNSCINAILYAADKYEVSPFHIVSRILQEQGTSGASTMNGYVYKGKIVYNLYNISVSGNSSAGFLKGAEYAYDHEWFTREASIIGGAEFLREKYFTTGQTTLYFQKYNVVDTSNLFYHQYMQNIRAANDEGYKMRKTYDANDILDSHFEFIIPMYNNMPDETCGRPRNIQATDIEFEKDRYIIYLDEAVDIPYTVIPANSYISKIEWSSSNPEILRVWNNRFRGIGEGIAEVIARTEDGRIEKRIKVIIRNKNKNYVQNVSFEKNRYIIYIDEAVDLPFTYSPNNSANAEFEWSSSNSEILRVWHNRFRGLKEGTAYVIVRTEDETYENKLKVVVRDPNKKYVDEICIEKQDYIIDINEAVDIPFTYEPQGSVNAEFEWSSSNSEILRVWNNRFRGLKEGTAYVTVKTKDESVEEKIKVKVVDYSKAKIEEIILPTKEYEIDIDEAIDIPFSYEPYYAQNSKVEWSSSNSEILRVWNNRFRGLKEGVAYVIVNVDNGNIKEKIKVIVKNPNKVYVKDIKLEKEEYITDIDEAVNLDFNYEPANSQNAEFEWSSSNPEVVRVCENRYRGLKVGTAEIIVRTKDGMFEKRIKVTVKNLNKPYVQNIETEEERYVIDINEAVDLLYTVTPSNSKNAEFEWSSSNSEILRVWNNRFRGLKEGIAYVIVRTLDHKYEKKIEVVVNDPNKIYVQNIIFNQEEYTIKEDEAIDLPYTITPSNSINAELEWSSSNSEILRVWNNRFRGLKKGAAEVIVRTKDKRYEKRIKVNIE